LIKVKRFEGDGGIVPPMAELAGNPFWYWKEHDMEMGMQMTCIGFPKATSLEREAALQLLRLQTLGALISKCRLAIEDFAGCPENGRYRARLEIGSTEDKCRRVGRCIRDSADAAVQRAFNIAVRCLELISLRFRP
jgi:hypothetical protein